MLSQHSGVNGNDMAASYSAANIDCLKTQLTRDCAVIPKGETPLDPAMEAARHLSLSCHVVMGVTVPTLFAKHDKG